MTDGDALLVAILLHPDDDNVRLVFADWLQEHGQEERAEFIRVQVELARLPEPEEATIFRFDGGPVCKACMRVRGGSGLCRYHELVRRELDLWSKTNPWERLSLPAGWVVGLNPSHGSGWAQHLHIHRGFVSEVRCTAADWLKHGESIRKQHPVTRVTLSGELTLEWIRQWQLAPDGDPITQWKWQGREPFTTTRHPPFGPAPRTIEFDALLALEFRGIEFGTAGVSLRVAFA